MMHFLPIGPQTLLVELADLAASQALFDALNADPVAGVTEIIPAARTLMIRTAPGVAADSALAAAILARAPSADAPRAAVQTEVIELPMRYDGEDLADVAQHMGLSVAEVIAAHQAALWQVAFCGFAPGFAYMTCDDPRFDLPRRPAPRTRIPAGSVALAGRFGGIYPQASPGGWQLIGTTDVPMWDLTRDPPALLRPGQRVRFVACAAQVQSATVPLPAPVTEGLHVLATAFPILMQDEGRPGQGGQGVSASGALDIGALRRANRRVGNPANAAALEITLGPVQLRADHAVTVALEGAADRAEIETAGRRLPADLSRPVALDPGESLLIHPPVAGMRSYLALRGGFAVDPVLGSAATDTLANVGPAPILAGDVVPLAHAPAAAVEPDLRLPRALPAPGQIVTLPVTLGPRTDWFSPAVVAQFLSQEWEVTAQSSRVGIRLAGAVPIRRDDAAELPSEGTETGAIQVPHSGQPVLFLADHPLTGGYPVIATLLPEALDLAAQIPPGARIRFTAARPFAPIQPDASQA
ncbi:urea amidolyase family protein [Gemmobacter fulvus]|uniref:5-oxoprolinase subunit B/C family protein n=1 Tax=Gemmobacter fulvus TaxID=2840474 RepID=UPI0027968B2B|nr:urea amidolyase family protein [Gemmobacter fulvus]MDQ1849620.1 urea amidolyase family protein [Gemmobacter fulvus]